MSFNNQLIPLSPNPGEKFKTRYRDRARFSGKNQERSLASFIGYRGTHAYFICDCNFANITKAFYFRANIELFSLIDNGKATSTKQDNALTDFALQNSMFINGIALNIHADAGNDLSNCKETNLGMMNRISGPSYPDKL